MSRQVPRLGSDEEAEAFLEQDLSDLDFAQFQPGQFEFLPKSRRINFRVPEALLEALKQRAEREGMSYQRYIRRVLERALAQEQRPSRS